MGRKKKPIKLCKNVYCVAKARQNSDYCSDWCRKADKWGVRIANKLDPKFRKYYQPCKSRWR